MHAIMIYLNIGRQIIWSKDDLIVDYQLNEYLIAKSNFSQVYKKLVKLGHE